MTEKERKTVESDQRVDTDRIFTLPNVLSIFRLLLIPLIIYFYETYHYVWAFGTLVLSGATDVVDGWIARTFHLVSDFGKAIDPIADKLTQIAILLCLMPMQYWWVVGVVVFKEVTIGLLTLTAIRRTRRVYSAGWYGKLCTVLSVDVCSDALAQPEPDLRAGRLHRDLLRRDALLLQVFPLLHGDPPREPPAEGL